MAEPGEGRPSAPKETPEILRGRVLENVARVEAFDPSLFLDDVTALDRTGALQEVDERGGAKPTETLELIRDSVVSDPDIFFPLADTLVERLMGNDEAGNREAVLSGLRVAHLLELLPGEGDVLPDDAYEPEVRAYLQCLMQDFPEALASSQAAQVGVATASEPTEQELAEREKATVSEPKPAKRHMPHISLPSKKRLRAGAVRSAIATGVAIAGIAAPKDVELPPIQLPAFSLPSLSLPTITPPEFPSITFLPEFSWPLKTTKVQEQTTGPAQTATPRPTETPKPTSTPDVKTIKSDIFREKITPKIYEEVQKRRDDRYANDAGFREGINFELAENRIDVLVTGSAIRLRDPETGEVVDDALTDSIQLFSYHIPTNTLHIISFPRDLQSPEVLRVSKDPKNSRINQAFAAGEHKLIREAVENATSLPVDFSINGNSDLLVDFINNTVKTIDVTLDREIRDNFYPTDDYGTKRIYYPKGVNTLDGQQALEISRSREQKPGGDYERDERLRKVIEVFAKKIMQEGNFFDRAKNFFTLRNTWYEKVKQNKIKPDFDLDSLFFDALKKELSAIPAIVSGVKIAEMPTFFGTGISNKNFVGSAGVPGDIYITKIAGGSPYSNNPRRDYWLATRQFTEKFLTTNEGQPPDEEEIKIVVPPKEQRILYPQELSYQEVKPWLGKLRDSHDAVITESIFTQELAQLPADLRLKVMEAIAAAHARALIKHYGDTEAIIGLDPGHGGTDVGSTATTVEGQRIAEKDLTWLLSQMIAEEIYQQSAGKYTVIFLRPQNPNDEDLDGDGYFSTVERLQKRKALLLQQELVLRKYGQPLGKNIVYLSVHLNGSDNPNQKGAEVFWPNDTAVTNPTYRESSMRLAYTLISEIVEGEKQAGYDIVDRGAKEDPDKRPPKENAETTVGPYIALGSSKLDRVLTGK